MKKIRQRNPDSFHVDKPHTVKRVNAKRPKMEEGQVIKLMEDNEHGFLNAKVVSFNANRVCFRGRKGKTGQFVKVTTDMSRRKFNEIRDDSV